MNPLIQLKMIVQAFFIALALICFRALPTAQAVVPAPDGGYPGGNTAEGTNALFSWTSGQFNTAVGLNALFSDTTGSRNTALGVGTLRFSVTGASNTAVGVNALYLNRKSYNTAVGDSALFSNTGGAGNTATGSFALYHDTNGGANTAIGYQALFRNSGGGGNTASGFGALINNTSGSNNTALGYSAGIGVSTANNVIAIGTQGFNVSNSCFIGNIYGQMAGFGTAVVINSSGKLGTISSSQRFKDDITPMDKASEVLFALKPVTFRYKKELDPAGILQFGLVAEAVEKINPDLVVRDADGKVNTVRYEQINAMLLNEFLKEHRKNEEQETTIARLQKQIDTLTAGLQKVSAQLEASKPAPQVANNP